MRTALRTSIVTATLAGAMLAPAAGAAFAATAAGTAPVARTALASTYGTASDNSRYEGRAVYIGEGLVAVLRNKAEGPEAWIRAVGPQWKPGDTYLVRVVTVLNRQQTTGSANGLSLELTEAGTAAPVLVVSKDGASKSYPLPKGRATAPAPCVSEVKQVQVGAGMRADLTMSPKGPKAFVHADPAGSWSVTLDRSHPKGPDSYYLVIVNPNGAKPVLEWKTQGGDVPVRSASFPALPKGCTFDHKVTDEQDGKPAQKPSPTPAGAKAQTVGQTTVVPRGPVAAGAELPVETVADTDNTVTAAAGAGLVAILAALSVSALRRRRDHR
ncbi:hypothetical protein OG389_23700 [Streptomyces sp. NBC_00435]|uniref:hypothetical protein n=1 Tax=Streptomyces sp. NBC_00435 TaxID=2903649 RepID=UPI002E202F6C